MPLQLCNSHFCGFIFPCFDSGLSTHPYSNIGVSRHINLKGDFSFLHNFPLKALFGSLFQFEKIAGGDGDENGDEGCNETACRLSPCPHTDSYFLCIPPTGRTASTSSHAWTCGALVRPAAALGERSPDPSLRKPEGGGKAAQTARRRDSSLGCFRLILELGLDPGWII